MSPINKIETIGIFGSVAVMAIALGLLRFMPILGVSTNTQQNQQGSVIVATEDAQDGRLAQALSNAANAKGKLENLVIDDVRIGTGATVKQRDTVTVNYIGTTQNGVEFDNSYKRGQPFTFTIGEGKVIAGWEKGLIGMKVGGQRILVIPPRDAYGDRQVGPIPPSSPLVFAIELISIK